MKKLLVVLFLGAFAACGTGDTATDKTDSLATAIDSTNEAKTDSLEEKTDSTIEKMDSITDAKTDTLKKN